MGERGILNTYSRSDQLHTITYRFDGSLNEIFLMGQIVLGILGVHLLADRFHGDFLQVGFLEDFL